MLNQFSRTQLLLGEEAMDKLKNSRVAVFGVGGVGGYVCEALARSGVGTFDLIDDDKVCLTNLNRQIIATRKTVGKYKVEVMKERILDINPDAQVNVHQCFFLPENADDFPFDEFLQTYRKAYYDLAKDGTPAKKGLHEILEVLKEKNLKIGVATSSTREHALDNFEREQITHYFDSIITGEMIEHGKPEPDIYVESCRQLKVDPKDAIALEDAINGIRSAHGAGMNPVIIPDIVQDTSKVDALLFGKCKSLLEFAEILKSIKLDTEE